MRFIEIFPAHVIPFFTSGLSDAVSVVQAEQPGVSRLSSGHRMLQHANSVRINRHGIRLPNQQGCTVRNMRTCAQTECASTDPADSLRNPFHRNSPGGVRIGLCRQAKPLPELRDLPPLRVSHARAGRRPSFFGILPTRQAIHQCHVSQMVPY